MTDFFKMDIFFVVTTAAVVILGILLALVLYRAYRILTNVDRISQDISEESHLVRADIAGMRSNIREQGFKVKFVRSFFDSTLGRFTNARKKKRG